LNNFLSLAAGAIPFTNYPYEGENVGCNVCGSDEKTALCSYDRRLKKLNTVICDNCGLLRTNPMPTDAELDAYYKTSYRLDYQLAGSKPPRHHIKRSTILAQDRYDKYKAVIPPNASVLDFGAGSGEFLKVCQDAGCKVAGIEPGTDYATFAKAQYGVTVHNSSWAKTDLGHQKFDVITSFHVFEHLRNPKDAMDFLVAHLSENGVIILEVPNMLPTPNGRKLFETLHFAHVFGFTPEVLAFLGQRCGLEIDDRVTAAGTNIVFRRPKSNAAAVSGDRQYARSLRNSYDKTDIVKFLFKFGWLVGIFKRISRDVRDSF